MHLRGIHHVTGFCGDPKSNVDFYCMVLGLRLVKVTVNYDDPGSYHLYYGDGTAEPGSLLTFFVQPGAPKGKIGVPQIGCIAYSVPANSLEFWLDRLRSFQVVVSDVQSRFDRERYLAFTDPDGLQLEIVEVAEDLRSPFAIMDIEVGHAIRGFHSAALFIQGFERSAGLLTESLGFRKVGEDQNRTRFACEGGQPGKIVDLVCLPGKSRGVMGPGTNHHIAWRVPSDDEHAGVRKLLVERGYNVTPVQNRTYFKSIYFREPSGILYEVATDGPGFTVDEPEEMLGSRLCLPEWMEQHREFLEQVLPAFETADGARFP